MLKSFLYLLTANVVFFGVVVAITDFGYEYDKAHQLFPETISWGDVSLEGRYGQRWASFFEYACWFAGLVNPAIVYVWYLRNKRSREQDLSIAQLDEELQV